MPQMPTFKAVEDAFAATMAVKSATIDMDFRTWWSIAHALYPEPTQWGRVAGQDDSEAVIGMAWVETNYALLRLGQLVALPRDAEQIRRRQACRDCGCTQENACIGRDGLACFWVEDDLCSVCAGGYHGNR